MIRLLTCVLLSLFLTETISAQKSAKPKKKRSDFFGGAEDYREITKAGFQLSFGPNYTVTRLHNPTVDAVDALNRPINYTVDPSGRIGGFIDAGMAHYRFKPSRVLGAIYKMRGDKGEIKWIGQNLFHRLDWGLGFDYIGGKEKITTNYLDVLGNVVSTSEEKGKFYNGYLYGRVTIDRFTKLSDKWHLETGMGLNFNYMVMEGSKDYPSAVIAEQTFQKNFLTQFHVHLGFQYKIKRGEYMIFGFYAPAIGIYEANRLKPTIQWYSSNYWPVHFQVKWIHHFTKKTKGCNTGSDADRKRNEEYMQNR